MLHVDSAWFVLTLSAINYRMIWWSGWRRILAHAKSSFNLFRIMKSFTTNYLWCTSHLTGSQSSRDRSESFSGANVPRTRTNSDSSSNASTKTQLFSQQNGNIKYLNNNMPPPTTIPNRPRSYFNPRNSPPHNSSPLSPPSTSYSTESDGSSISIDETDFSHKITDEHMYK